MLVYQLPIPKRCLHCFHDWVNQTDLISLGSNSFRCSYCHFWTRRTHYNSSCYYVASSIQLLDKLERDDVKWMLRR